MLPCPRKAGDTAGTELPAPEFRVRGDTDDRLYTAVYLSHYRRRGPVLFHSLAEHTKGHLLLGEQVPAGAGYVPGVDIGGRGDTTAGTPARRQWLF